MSRIFPILTKETYMLYAAWKYNNSTGTWTDYFSDMKLLNKLLKNISEIEKSNLRSILNGFIYFSNIFRDESLSRILFFLAENEKEACIIKTILYFLYRLPDDIPEKNINEISIDSELLEKLECI